MTARGSSDLRDLVHGGHDAMGLAADAARDDAEVTLQPALGGARACQLRVGTGEAGQARGAVARCCTRQLS